MTNPPMEFLAVRARTSRHHRYIEKPDGPWAWFRTLATSRCSSLAIRVKPTFLPERGSTDFEQSNVDFRLPSFPAPIKVVP